jgi:hypothetical protein
VGAERTIKRLSWHEDKEPVPRLARDQQRQLKRLGKVTLPISRLGSMSAERPDSLAFRLAAWPSSSAAAVSAAASASR